jgi:lysophospholipase L1-like esterase
MSTLHVAPSSEPTPVLSSARAPGRGRQRRRGAGAGGNARPRRIVSACVAAVASIVAASGLAIVPTAPASAATTTSSNQFTAGLNYVAMGDSYSAGLGITPLSDNSVAGCAQSADNYPHQVAAALGMKLTDVTCSGATTANVIQTPQVMQSGTAAPQIDALSAATNVVTITIGGNDMNLFNFMTGCTALSANGPLVVDHLANNCRDKFAPLPGAASTADQVNSMVAPGVARALAAIRKAAPNAKIFVLGYPSVTPDAADTPASGCYTSAFSSNGKLPNPVNTFPFTTVDTAYLHSVQQDLETSVENQATIAGDTFIPVFSVTGAHSACAPPADQFINGMTVAWDYPVQYSANTLHPNLAAMTFLSGLVGSEITAAFQPAPLTQAWLVSLPPLYTIGGGAVVLVLLAGTALLSGRAVHRRRISRRQGFDRPSSRRRPSPRQAPAR